MCWCFPVDSLDPARARMEPPDEADERSGRADGDDLDEDADEHDAQGQGGDKRPVGRARHHEDGLGPGVEHGGAELLATVPRRCLEGCHGASF